MPRSNPRAQASAAIYDKVGASRQISDSARLEQVLKVFAGTDDTKKFRMDLRLSDIIPRDGSLSLPNVSDPAKTD